MQSIKEHNLKANHNKPGNVMSRACLYAIYQRTQFESKSQLQLQPLVYLLICMQSIKEHNLKANHNLESSAANRAILYAIYQRTQFESKSQLTKYFNVKRSVCMQSIKEHNLKANHNYPVLVLLIAYSVCNLSKNTIWKQITTCCLLLLTTPFLYAIYQRTQFESKSQLPCLSLHAVKFCMQSIKEHNLKANHN